MIDRHTGTTADTSLELPLDALGSPGTQGVLAIKAIFQGWENENPIRFNDTSGRPFDIKAKLSQNPAAPYDFNSAFDRSHGSSHLLVPKSVDQLVVSSPQAEIRLEKNEKGQLSLAAATITATSPFEARIVFHELLTSYLDRMAYLAGVPAHIALTMVRDVQHEVQHLYFVAPPRLVTASTGGEALADEMRPIYALYREGMNSSSPYYRVLCFFKIIEGLLGPLRASAHRRAQLAKIVITKTKDVVPEHPDIPPDLRPHIGTPIKTFYDTFLGKEFRDAMAHFTLRAKNALNVSSLQDVSRFTDAAFISDLCVRALISKHEQLVAAVLAAKKPKA